MGRPILRTPELADRFVAETIAIIESDGVEGVTTRAAATAAGSSLASLNQLFGGRTGLLDAVALRGFELLRDDLDQVGSSPDPRERLLGLCVTYRRVAGERPRLLRLMYSQPHAAFNPDAGDEETGRAIRQHFTNPFAAMMEARSNDPQVVAASIGLISLLEGLALQEQGGTLGSTPESASNRWRLVIEMYIDGACHVARSN